MLYSRFAIRNVLSDKFSVKALWIGVVSAVAFLVVGLLLDRWGVNKHERPVNLSRFSLPYKNHSTFKPFEYLLRGKLEEFL